MSVRGAVLAAMGVIFIFAIGAAPSSAAVSGDDICPGRAQPALMGDSIATAVELPYVPATSPQRFYEGAILRPANTYAFPGKRPSVVLQPGLGQNKCTLWWAAQYLAGHGFVVAVHDTPDPGLSEDPDFPDMVEWVTGAIAGNVAVVDFLRTDSSASTYADVDRLGLAGYDEGAIVASTIDTRILGTDVQTDLGIDAIVSFNNLRSRLTGDVSAPGLQCFGEPQGWFIPVSPALGFAEDRPCSGMPDVFDPAIKLGGWRTWRSYGFPTMEVVLRGSRHEDFADDNGGENLWKDAGSYATAWFRRWLGPDPSQENVLLAPTLNGRSTTDALSQTFQSAAFLPSVIDTDDLTCDLGGTCLKPPPEPDPDPEPNPHVKKPDIHSKLIAPIRTVRPGSLFRIRMVFRNLGDAAALNVRVCMKGRNARPVGRRCRVIAAIGAKTTMYRRYGFRVNRGVKPGQKVTGIIVEKDGGSSTVTYRVARPQR